MNKMFQRFGLKLRLLGFGASSLLLPWVGVQHLEAVRTSQSEEKLAGQEREFQLQQQIDDLNQQVSSDKQQIAQKDAALKIGEQQHQQQSMAQSISRSSTSPTVSTRVKKPVARTAAS